MTDTTKALIDALNNLLNSGGGISEATNEELQEAINNQDIDEIIRTQAEAVLNARHALEAVKLWREATTLGDEEEYTAFEAWYSSTHDAVDLSKRDDGLYVCWDIDLQWNSWKAALLYSKQQNVFNKKEFDEMVKRGSEAWKDTTNNFVDNLRGN